MDEPEGNQDEVMGIHSDGRRRCVVRFQTFLQVKETLRMELGGSPKRRHERKEWWMRRDVENIDAFLGVVNILFR